MSKTGLAEINTFLTGAYVLLTLIIAGATIWSLYMTRTSLDLTRQQIDINKQQSQDALAASEKHSQAAIDAVHEQIEQSKRQAQLERFAENRPLLMPEGTPTFQSDKPQWLKWDVNEQLLAIHNIGAGAALNVASVLYGCESYLIDWNTNRRSDHEKRIHWTCWLG